MSAPKDTTTFAGGSHSVRFVWPVFLASQNFRNPHLAFFCCRDATSDWCHLINSRSWAQAFIGSPNLGTTPSRWLYLRILFTILCHTLPDTPQGRIVPHANPCCLRGFVQGLRHWSGLLPALFE